MTLTILHSSDLHGHYKRVLKAHANTSFDAWLDTGDFLETAGRKRGDRIIPELERSHQVRWLQLTNLVPRLVEWLNGRPAIMVQGNHDFINLPLLLKNAGANVYPITTSGVSVLGYTWAGFREVNWIDGEWVGETQDLTPMVDATMETNPDILITHAPPAGIMDDVDGYGIKYLTSSLCYQGHKIKAHFFGHCHRSHGQTSEMGIDFFNGAEHAKLISLF